MAQSIPGVGTSRHPAAVIAPPYGGVFIAWKGEGDDQRLFWTKTEQLTPDASSGRYSFNPSPQAQVVFPATGQHAASSHAPALAFYQSELYMAWKGEDGDDAIHWSVWYGLGGDGTAWSKPTRLPAATTIAPALVASEYGLFLVFQGKSDKKIWWAMLVNAPGYDGGNFTILGPIKVGDRHFETSATPSLTTDGKSVTMAWNSADGTSFRLAKCAYTQQLTIWPPGTLPATGGISTWGNFQWESEEVIPPYSLDTGNAEDGQPSFASGAGPSVTGPAVVDAGTGIYLGWVGPRDPVQGLPWLQFSCRIASEPNSWQSGTDSVGIGPPGHSTPAFIPAFCPGPDASYATPIYFFKGLSDDPNIYYECTSILYFGGGGGGANVSDSEASSGETQPLQGNNP